MAQGLEAASRGSYTVRCFMLKLLSGDPLTKAQQATGIFRKLGPERPEVTPGGNRCKTSGAHGLGAGIAEPGNDGEAPVTLGNTRRGETPASA